VYIEELAFGNNHGSNHSSRATGAGRHCGGGMSAVAQPLAAPENRIATLLSDYAQLTKLRVTILIVLTAWCGYYFGCLQAGVSSISWNLFHALLGIGMVSSGTAALNEVLEHKIDANMRRTARRPIPAGRMSVLHGTVVGLALTLGGALYLGFALNPLTGGLSLATAVVYLAAYTPLKRISPICTFVGAFPGAMPGVLGWAAVRGRLEWSTLVIFAIVFLWQFPHFFSIAWLYRDDYADGGIQMLPVVDPDGRSTSWRILAYSLVLIPVSVLPTVIGMSGRFYLWGAVFLGLAYLYVGIRLTRLGLPVTAPISKLRARQLLQASVLYLPLLFTLMMTNSLKP
jgi:protoheme IX farnesyltransferase